MILQSSLPNANSLLLCFYELFFERNYWRSLHNFQFSDEFSLYYYYYFFKLVCNFVFPSVPFFCGSVSLVFLESFCFFLRLRTLFASEVPVMMPQAGYRLFPGLESSH